MNDYSAELKDALQSDCAHSMEPLMEARNPQDYADMLALLSGDSSDQARARVLFTLGRWGDSKAVPEIRKALPTLDEVGRLTAIDALGRLNTAPALEGVLELTNDPSPHVRISVLKALSRFDKPKAARSLQKMMESEKEKFVKEYAKKILRAGKQPQ